MARVFYAFPTLEFIRSYDWYLVGYPRTVLVLACPHEANYKNNKYFNNETQFKLEARTRL